MTSFQEIFQNEYSNVKWDEFKRLIRDLQDKINYHFNSQELIWRALSIRGSNLPTDEFERLEYLGDGLLDCFTSIILYDQSDGLPPEELTRYRSILTNNTNLAKIAKGLNLDEIGKLLGMGILSPGQAADAFESLVGSIFIDTTRNFDKTLNVVSEIAHFNDRLETIRQSPWGTKDPKSFLHEWVQQEYKNEAEVIYDDRNEGTANAPEFYVKAIIEKKTDREQMFEGVSVGPFSRKKQAEKEASKSLLTILREKGIL
ncbi:MAG: ribonuclease III family protein [Candidatus Hodarchaeota archaeon]